MARRSATVRTPVAELETLPGDDDGDVLLTGEAVRLDLRPAGFVIRGAAAAIDVIATWLVFLVVLILTTATGAFEALPGALQGAVWITVVVLLFIAVPTAVETATKGRSLGQLALGVRIVRDDGGAIGFRHAFVRAMVGFAELYLLFGGPAALVGFLTRRTKRVGDLLAGTYGQYERVSRFDAPLFGVPTGLTGWAATADVGRIPAPLARRIRQFLAQAPRMLPDRREATARALAGEASAWVSPLPDAPAELFLAAVAVVRRDRESRALALESQRLATLAPTLQALPHSFPDRG